MQLTETNKAKILDAIKADYARKQSRDGSISQSRHANFLAINPSVYSRMMKGDVDRVLGENDWIRIGMELMVDMDGLNWQWATTSTMSVIYTQLEYCKEQSLSAIFCDDKGIGKTAAARLFARDFPNVAYVDCSQCKTKRELIRMIARKFGFDYRGKLSEIRANLVNNILTLDHPIIILDESGDLCYEADLEIKSLWNALEYVCAFYSMGANGLKTKIDRMIYNQKVGYEELFDRFGDRYQNVTRDLSEANKALFSRFQAESILKANLPGISAKQTKDILNACNLNLRRLRIEIIKFKTGVAA